MKSTASLLLLLLVAFGLQSCFTGVESTPKITYKEVRHNQAGTTAEQRMAAEMVAQPLSQWQAGKQFRVSSDRIALAFVPASIARHAPAEGDTLTYVGSRGVTAVDGSRIVELLFTTPHSVGDTAAYRTNATAEQLAERRLMEIPFAVDLDLVQLIASRTLGQRYWLRTPLRYDRWGQSQQGRKFVEVEILDVEALNDIYPARLHFRETASGADGYLYMSTADARGASPRGFDTLFALADPRKVYPMVTDLNWQAIVLSQPRIGMTRDEALLALGSPKTIDRAHNQSSAYERWGYADGTSLILEDGIVARIGLQ